MTTAFSIKTPARSESAALWTIAALYLGYSFLVTPDRVTWAMEVCWVVAALPALVIFWRRLPLTRLAYWLLFFHALVLIQGGTYTYAEAPLGFWLKDLFDFARNPWDRIGHFMQGFEPAILARELLLRFSPLKRGKLLVYIVLSICLGFSAFYELLEWWAALVFGEGADAFLATQGDQWDTQWDMFLCLFGAVCSLSLFSRLHDRQLVRPVEAARAPNP
jgi:putative membrane protein